MALAGYPPEHPDFEPRDGIADVVAQDLKPYAVDGALGPILPASGLVIEDDGAAGRIVAVLLVNDREACPRTAAHGSPMSPDSARRRTPAPAGLSSNARWRSSPPTDVRALSLAVTNGNPARKLYEQLGIRHVYSAQTLLLP